MAMVSIFIFLMCFFRITGILKDRQYIYTISREFFFIRLESSKWNGDVNEENFNFFPVRYPPYDT